MQRYTDWRGGRELARLMEAIAGVLIRVAERRRIHSARCRILLTGMVAIGAGLGIVLGFVAGAVSFLAGYGSRLFIFFITAFAIIGALQGLRSGRAALTQEHERTKRGAQSAV